MLALRTSASSKRSAQGTGRRRQVESVWRPADCSRNSRKIGSLFGCPTCLESAYEKTFADAADEYIAAHKGAALPIEDGHYGAKTVKGGPRRSSKMSNAGAGSQEIGHATWLDGV